MKEKKNSDWEGHLGDHYMIRKKRKKGREAVIATRDGGDKLGKDLELLLVLFLDSLGAFGGEWVDGGGVEFV